MKNKAIENFKNGYSCSESNVKAAADCGIASQELIKIATPFSGGISSGCLCGAVAGMQLVIGATMGRTNNETSPSEAKACAKLAMDEFKKLHKVTCCRALTSGLEMASPERKQHCFGLVSDCAEILEKICKTRV